MKCISKFLLIGLSAISLSSFASAQISGTYKPKGPLTPVDFTVPPTKSIANHSSGWVDLTASDNDEYWVYDINQWKPINGWNTSGSISFTSTIGSGVTIQYLSGSGNTQQRTYRYGITVDISGTPPGSFVVNFTYDDGDPESLLYDPSVTKSLTVTIL